MYYLVQSNIHSDPDHPRIFEALESLGLPYETIALGPDTDRIALTESDRKDVFVYGSVKLARLARARTDWHPGSFYGGNHLFEVYAPHYQDNLLNYGTEVFEFGADRPWRPHEQQFIKPYQTAKIFTGKVFTETKWKDFVEESLRNPRTPLLHAGSLVQSSVPQQILKEARLWIVGGEIVGAVYYKYHGDVLFEREVSPEGLAFAKEMIARFCVADAFVMDICLCSEGWKMVEINCINSAGFYPALDVKALLRALEIFFG